MINSTEASIMNVKPKNTYASRTAGILSVPSYQKTVINFASTYFEYLKILLQKMVPPYIKGANDAANSVIFTVAVLVLLTVVNQETNRLCSV
jgi:hypothetical protein